MNNLNESRRLITGQHIGVLFCSRYVSITQLKDTQLWLPELGYPRGCQYYILNPKRANSKVTETGPVLCRCE